MPTYDFFNKETNEHFSKFMSISAKEEFLAENQHIEQRMMGAPGLVSGVNMNKKMDNGWKENLARIAESHPNSALADKLGGRSVSKVRSNEIAKKHGLRKSGAYTMSL